MSRYTRSEAESEDTATPKAAAIYVRISKDSEELGFGVARQEQDCRRDAEERGWIVAEVYRDNNLSAWQKEGKRPAFTKMLADIRDGKRDGIIIYNLDRFTRRMDDAVDIVKLIEDTKVPILDSETEWDLTNKHKQVEFYHAANANFKASNDTSRRTTRGKKAQAQRGEPTRSQDQFGYKFIEKTSKTPPTYDVVPEQKKIVQDVYKRFIAGESKHSIAARLNSKGIKTVNGKQWQSKTISDLLARPANAGIASYQSELLPDVEVNWEPLVEKSVYYAALELMKKSAEESYRRNNKTREPKSGLLTGILRCSQCSYNLHLGGKKRTLADGSTVLFDQYLCTRAGCNKVARSAEAIERVVNAIIERTLSRVEVPESDSSEDDDLVTQLEDLKKRKTELQVAHTSGALSLSDFMAMNPMIDRQIDDVNKKMAHSAATVQKPELLDQWKNGTVGQKRAVIKLFIDYIAVKPSGRGRKFDISQLVVVTREEASKDSQSSEDQS